MSVTVDSLAVIKEAKRRASLALQGYVMDVDGPLREGLARDVFALVERLEQAEAAIEAARRVMDSGSLATGGVLVDIGEATDLQIALASIPKEETSE